MTFEEWATSKGIKPKTATERATYALMKATYTAGQADVLNALEHKEQI